MNEHRVLVTGVGVVSALASQTKQHFQRLLQGESAVTVSVLPSGSNYAPWLEAKVSDFDRRTVIKDRTLRKLLSTSSGFAVGAAGQAIEDAGVAEDSELLKCCGLYVGSISLDIVPETFIPVLKASVTSKGDFEIGLFARRAMVLLDPLFLVKALPNAGACGISIQHQILGPNTNLTNGPVSGLQAIACATAAIRRGETACAVAGGYDSVTGMDCVSEGIITGQLSKRTDDPPRGCRPFDQEREGYALGEGGAFVFLESAEHALARGAPMYGEILSISHTTDAAQLQKPDPSDATIFTQAAAQALAQAGCRPAELGVIFGDGRATKSDDQREALVVQHLLDGAQVPFTAATGALGFTGAASGAFSLVHALMALRQQVVLPLTNCFQPDPQSAIHFLRQAQEKSYRRALVWNSDRGIKNIAVLLGSYEP